MRCGAGYPAETPRVLGNQHRKNKMENEMEQKAELLTFISDLHKDVWGSRPRGLYDDLPLDELKKVHSALCDQYEEQYRQSCIRRVKNWILLKKCFAKLVEIGAKDFRQALQMDMEAEGANGDFDYYCYLKKISYGKADVFERLAA